MTAPQILGLVLLAAVVVGFPIHRRAVRKEKARAAAVEALLAQHRMENVGRLVTFPQQTLSEAMAADVIEEAEMLCRLDSWEWGA